MRVVASQKLSQDNGETFPETSIDTEYDRDKVPPCNGNDPPPAPASLKALLSFQPY